MVSGDAKNLLIDAYSACVTAGALHRMNIDPTMLSIDDLWGHPVNKTRDALAAAWREAVEDESQYRMIRLDDVDAERLSPWFDQFADLFRKTRPANLFFDCDTILIVKELQNPDELRNLRDGKRYDDIRERRPETKGDPALRAQPAVDLTEN